MLPQISRNSKLRVAGRLLLGAQASRPPIFVSRKPPGSAGVSPAHDFLERGRLCLLVFLLLSVGCGYRQGSLLPPGPTSIAVPIFENDTFYRGFEFLLTQSVIEEILTKTPLRISPSPQADTVLEGKIVDLTRPTITKDTQRQPTQFTVSITVLISWKDRRTQKFILPPTTLSQSAEAILGRGESFKSASNEAFRDLARKIVQTLEWISFAPAGR